MGRLYLDSTGSYSNPAETSLKYLRADGQWATPDTEYKWLDAAGEYTVPELFVPPDNIADATWEDIGKLGDLAAKSPDEYKKYIGQDKELTVYDPEAVQERTAVAKIVDVGIDELESGGISGFTFWIYQGMFPHKLYSAAASVGYENSEMQRWLDILEFRSGLGELLQNFLVKFSESSGDESIYRKVSLMSFRNLSLSSYTGEDSSWYPPEWEGSTYQYFKDHSSNLEEAKLARYHYAIVGDMSSNSSAWTISRRNRGYPISLNNYSNPLPGDSSSITQAKLPSARFCIGSNK